MTSLMECQNHESPNSFHFVHHILLTKVESEHIYFWENSNNEGEYKMIFVVTSCTRKFNEPGRHLILQAFQLIDTSWLENMARTYLEIFHQKSVPQD